MASARTDRPFLLWPGILVGVGLAGTLDEVVLHQLLGAGGFNLYDGTIQHKLLRLQQIRLRRTHQPIP